MPEWFTPLLRVLVAIPSLGNFSTRNTSCQRFDTALAMAHPMTPPPIIKMLAWSMNSEYRKYKEEKRKLLAGKFGLPIILVVYSTVVSRKYFEIVSAVCFRSATSVLSVNSALSIFPMPSRLLVPTNCVKERRARHQPRLASVMHRVRSLFACFIPIAPQRSGAMRPVLVDRVEVNVKRPELLLVVLVVACHSPHGFKAGVRRRFALAHHFDDGVPARNLDVLLALAGRACRPHFIVHAAARPNDRRVPHAPRNFPRQSGSRRRGGNVPVRINSHARNRTGGRMRDDAFGVRDLFFISVEDC